MGPKGIEPEQSSQQQPHRQGKSVRVAGEEKAAPKTDTSSPPARLWRWMENTQARAALIGAIIIAGVTLLGYFLPQYLRVEVVTPSPTPTPESTATSDPATETPTPPEVVVLADTPTATADPTATSSATPTIATPVIATTPAPAEDEPALYITIQEELLFIQVNSGLPGPVSLNGLTLASSGNVDRPVAIVDRFGSLRLTNGEARPGSCYAWVAAGRSPALPSSPEACSRNNTHIADIFWHDFTVNQTLDVGIYMNGELVAICSPVQPRCPVSIP